VDLGQEGRREEEDEESGKDNEITHPHIHTFSQTHFSLRPIG